jgi:Flp pilus assembly protein TadG
MSSKPLVSFWHDCQAAALVEMTTLMPFLLFLGCGIFEFGAFFYQYQMVEAGVRDAARYMARVTDTSSSSPCGTSGCTDPCDPGVLAKKVTNAQDIAVMGQIGGTTQRVFWWKESDVKIDYSTVIANPMISGYPTYRGPTSGIRIIKVSTSPSYPGVGFLGMLGLGPTITIALEHQERCIGSG